MTSPTVTRRKRGVRWKCAEPCGLRIRGHACCRECTQLAGEIGHELTSLSARGLCAACEAWRLRQRRKSEDTADHGIFVIEL